MRYTRSACAASAASKASERRYAASNFSATAPPCLCRSSVGVTTRARYPASVAGIALSPASARYRARSLSSSAKKALRSEFFAASSELSSGKISASA